MENQSGMFGAALYIGPGVAVEGRLVLSDPKDAVIIAGRLRGDIQSDGLVIVEKSGTIDLSGQIVCKDLQVRGKIQKPTQGGGAGACAPASIRAPLVYLHPGSEVTGAIAIDAGLLRMAPEAVVRAEEIRLPTGGLEQVRGSVLCARLTMSDDHPFAKDLPPLASASPLAPDPMPAALVSAGAAAGAGAATEVCV